METNNLPAANTTAVGRENSKIDSIFLQENINRFSEQFFRQNTQQFSRYRIERLWASTNKTDVDSKRVDELNAVFEISCWNYPARRLHKAVSEPNLRKIWLLGTRAMQKSNSFHQLLNFDQRSTVTVEPIGPKLVTWSYVTRAQCRDINFTKTDQDLLNIFVNDPFVWKTSYESRIMCRLLADTAKYCKEHEFTDEKMSALLGIYYHTHSYNKSLSAMSYDEVYRFFEELIVRHSVLMPPDHVDLFSAEEAKRLIANFSNKYLICLPLVRHVCELPNHPEPRTSDKENKRS